MNRSLNLDLPSKSFPGYYNMYNITKATTCCKKTGSPSILPHTTVFLISIGSNSTSLPKGLSDIVIPSTARGRSQSLFSIQFDIFQIVGITNY